MDQEKRDDKLEKENGLNNVEDESKFSWDLNQCYNEEEEVFVPSKFKWDLNKVAMDDTDGTPEEQKLFIEELGNFHREKGMKFKPPKFYKKPLNLLKLWRSVSRKGGYEKVTLEKLWKQIGDSFEPPQERTNVAASFRDYYEKFLLEFEKHSISSGELQAQPSVASPVSLGVDVVHQEKASHQTTSKQLEVLVNDLGPPADWVKIKVLQTEDCFEIYALVPGLPTEEVQVEVDPAGRVLVSCQPKNVASDPWGVTAFKKEVRLPVRIDAQKTSLVTGPCGRILVRAAFEKTF